MKDIEDALNDAEKEFEQLKAPEEFEQRLRSALTAKRKPRLRINRAVAAILVAALFTFASSFVGVAEDGIETVLENVGQDIHDISTGITDESNDSSPQDTEDHDTITDNTNSDSSDD